MSLSDVLILCSVLSGLAAATGPLSFNPGQEYVFSYSGRLLTGIPELSESHYSGLGVRAQVVLTVRGNGEYGITIQDAKYTKINGELKPSSGAQGNQGQESTSSTGPNWRNLELPNYSDLPASAAQSLRKPTVFKMNSGNGEFESMTVDQNEPTWSLNFKKGIVVLFQTKGLGNTESSVDSNMASDLPEVSL